MAFSYDPKCEELAWYFLGGSAHDLTVKHFAQGIQDYIEGEIEDMQERHATGCICADCSGAELTADND